MKRFFRSLIDGFVCWVRMLEKQEKIAYAIGAIIGILGAILLFVYIDKVPATETDYAPFENQAIAAQKNPELLFETDCNITVNNGIVTVYFENEECKVTAQYNQDFELLSISKENGDNYIFGLWAFLLALIVGFVIFGAFSLLIYLCWCLFEDFCNWILNKRKATKTNSQN